MGGEWALVLALVAGLAGMLIVNGGSLKCALGMHDLDFSKPDPGEWKRVKCNRCGRRSGMQIKTPEED